MAYTYLIIIFYSQIALLVFERYSRVEHAVSNYRCSKIFASIAEHCLHNLRSSEAATLFQRDQAFHRRSFNSRQLKYESPRHCRRPVVPKLGRAPNEIKVAIMPYYPQYFAVIAHNIEQCFSTFLRYGLFSGQYKPSRTQDKLRLRE